MRVGPEAYAAYGTPAEPGTTLLTLPGSEVDEDGERSAVVVETAYGTTWRELLGAAVDRPVLLGGFHGTWAAAGALADARVSRGELRERGLSLGAGVVIPLPEGACPVRATADIVGYLAGEAAGRCGPCLNGLPALAAEVGDLARLDPGLGLSRIVELASLVERRGACAHPDGTARLVRSMLSAFEDEVAAHRQGRCMP